MAGYCSVNPGTKKGFAIALHFNAMLNFSQDHRGPGPYGPVKKRARLQWACGAGCGESILARTNSLIQAGQGLSAV